MKAPQVIAQQPPTLQQLSSTRGNPRFIKLNSSTKQKTNGRTGTLNDEEVLRNYLPMQVEDSYQLLRSQKDSNGSLHNVYQQYHNGLKVAFGTFTIHRTATNVQTLSGNFITIDEKETLSPSIDHESASERALEYIPTSNSSTQKASKGTLVYCKDFYNKNDDRGHLAYRFQIATTDPVGLTEVFVDAEKGHILFANDLIRVHQHSPQGNTKIKTKPTLRARTTRAGNAVTKYHGIRQLITDPYQGGYRLLDKTRGSGIHTKNAENINEFSVFEPSFSFEATSEFVDKDNNWTAEEWDNNNSDIAALDTHWALGQTYDYFMEEHGRDSYDGKGSLLKNLVHIGKSYASAYWYNGTVQYGEDVNGLPFTAIDFVAHEMTHGVTETTANLVYYAQSGALNESISDIFATAVKSKKMPERSIWEINPIAAEKKPIRDMSDPNRFQHPDTYKGDFWKEDDGSGKDNRHVHTNSSVLNHWFYLLSEGKSGSNDDDTKYNVKGIGIDKAADVVYRMLTTYLEPTSDYLFAKFAGIQSAEDIFGVGSFEAKQVAEAFKAIGVEESKDVDCKDNIKNLRVVYSGATSVNIEWDYTPFDDKDLERFASIRFRHEGEEQYRYREVEKNTEFSLSRENKITEIGLKTPCNDTWETIYIPETIPCGKVENIEVVSINKSKGEFSISWDPIKGAKAYKLVNSTAHHRREYITDKNRIMDIPYLNMKAEPRISVFAECSPEASQINLPAISSPSIAIESPLPMDAVGKSFSVKFKKKRIRFDEYFGDGVAYYVDNKQIGIWYTDNPIPILSLSPGKHSIKLVLYKSKNLYLVTPEANDSVIVSVDENISPTVLPTPKFTYSLLSVPHEDNYSTVIDLSAAQSFDTDGSIVSYLWDLDGGRFVQGSTKSDKNPKVTFAGDKTYNITLTITDNDGNIAKRTRRLRSELSRSAAKENPEALTLDTEDKIQAYPNPVSDILYLSVPKGSGRTSAYLMDMQGKEVGSLTVTDEHPVSMDVSHCKAGVYRLVFLSSDAIYSEMVMVK